MNSRQLNRIFNLIRETGDRLVVADNESNEVFVLMPIDDYENIVGLSKGVGFGDSGDDEGEEKTDYIAPRDEVSGIGSLSEQKFLEKINDDIAEWRSAQKKKAEESIVDEISEEKANISVKKDIGMTALGEVLQDEKYINGDFDEKERSHPNLGPEEDLKDVPEDRVVEEKFYLEPVE